MNSKPFYIIFFISGFLFVLIIVLFNPKNIIIDTFTIIGTFIITLFFTLCYLKMNKEVKTNDN